MSNSTLSRVGRAVAAQLNDGGPYELPFTATWKASRPNIEKENSSDLQVVVGPWQSGMTRDVRGGELDSGWSKNYVSPWLYTRGVVVVPYQSIGTDSSQVEKLVELYLQTIEQIEDAIGDQPHYANLTVESINGDRSSRTAYDEDMYRASHVLATAITVQLRGIRAS